ncbi:MAG: T9SS type A sorting domain-containing protein [Bacteroidales bacterium]|nr:T9SS type A sorting domain-containing protein [Bacteroidales bacterium]
MKRLTLLFVVLFAASLLNAQETFSFRANHPQGVSIESSTANGLKLHYAVNEIGIANIDNGEARGQEIIMKGSFGSFAEGLPNLPCENHYIAVPRGATVNIEVKENGRSTLNDIDLLPAAEVIENAAVGLPKLRKDMSVFGHDANFPSENVSIAQTTQIRGLDVILLSITPFRYNPVRKTLEVIHDMDIDIHFEGGDGQFGEARYRNPDWDGILHDLVINSEMLPEAHYYDLLNNALTSRENGCEYLIISPDDEDILAWADTLKRFRTKQGILTKVVSTTECGGNTTEAIKGYIQNAYEHWAIPPAAVMIFGGLAYILPSDEEVGIPGFPLLFLNYEGTGLNYDYLSDNLYTDMNGDSIPDMAISRLPAYSIEEYEIEINKIIQYETNPPTDPEYYSRPIITSGYEDTKWFLITSQAVNSFYRKKLGKQPWNFYMVYHSFDPIPAPDTAWSIGYNTNAVVDYFGPNGQNYIAQTPDTLSDWRDMFNYSYLVDALSQGSFLTLYRDHSGESMWCCPYVDAFDLLRLTNNTTPTFLLSIGCHTGDYTRVYNQGSLRKSPLIAAFCSHEVGALGGIGATTVTHSHYNDMLTWGVIDYFWPNFMPGLGTETSPEFTRPAYGLVAGKLFLNQYAFMPNYWPVRVATTHNVFHDLGEAYLNLYTEVPQPINVVAESFTNNQTQYTFTAEKGALVCLSHNDEIISIVQATGNPQSIDLHHLPIGEHFHFTVTGKNKIRYEQEVIVNSPDQPYVYTKQFQISGNSQFDAGEVTDINVTLHNHSQIASSPGTLTLLCESPYVEIAQGTASYSSINPEASRTLTKAFKVHIASEVPDQAVLDFIIQFNENENTHQDHFRFNANAPILNINPEVRFLTADGQPSSHISNEGNSSVLFSVSNTGHADARFLCATLDIKAPFVNIEAPSYTQQSLAPNEELTIAYTLNTTPNAVTGAWLQSRLELQYDKHETYCDNILQYGGIYENFEGEELNPFFKWTSIGLHKWDYCAEDAYEGQRCFVANADTGASSTLKAQLKQEHVNHNCKISFHYKTADNDTLLYYNNANGKITSLSSKDWQYAEVDYNGSDRYFIWSYKQTDSNSCQAKIDDICFPPLHTAIAYAGDDMLVCDNMPIELNSAYAYDCESVQWTSEGDGVFSDSNSVNPVYTPGAQDLATGTVTLTLTAAGDETIVSSTQIRFVDGISFGAIIGDSIVNKYQEPVSRYSIEKQPGVQYHWNLEPATVGAIYEQGNAIDIQWNQHEGDAEVTLSVSADNGCTTEPAIKRISLIGYSTSEWHPVSFNLFPNPTNGKVNLTIEEPLLGKATVEVYNLLGERLSTKKVSNLAKGSTVSIDLSRLTPGLYIIKLNAEKGISSKKVSLK